MIEIMYLYFTGSRYTRAVWCLIVKTSPE